MNKNEINKYAKRFMGNNNVEHMVLMLTNAGNVDKSIGYLSTDYLPKDPTFGQRLLRTGKRILIEKLEMEGIKVGENIVLTRWSMSCLTSQ